MSCFALIWVRYELVGFDYRLIYLLCRLDLVKMLLFCLDIETNLLDLGDDMMLGCARARCPRPVLACYPIAPYRPGEGPEGAYAQRRAG